MRPPESARWPPRSPATRLQGGQAALFIGPHNGSSVVDPQNARVAGSAWLDGERMAHALAIALYQPPYGLWPGFMGPDTKLLTAAEPAVQGARAALLAAEGVTGALDVIENRRGLLTHLSFAPRPSMLGGLGDVWLTDTLAFKPYPGCAYLQSAVDAALAAEVAPADVAAIDVAAGLLTVEMEALSHAAGLTAVGVTFSAARSVAIALIASRLTHHELSPDWLAAHEAEARELASRVRVRHDWGLTIETARGPAGGGRIGARRPADDLAARRPAHARAGDRRRGDRRRRAAPAARAARPPARAAPAAGAGPRRRDRRARHGRDADELPHSPERSPALRADARAGRRRARVLRPPARRAARGGRAQERGGRPRDGRARGGRRRALTSLRCRFAPTPSTSHACTLSSGQGRQLELHTTLDPFELSGERYAVEPGVIELRLDVSRMTAGGYALRLRFGTRLAGPCMRCLEPAAPSLEVDAREVEQPGRGGSTNHTWPSRCWTRGGAPGRPTPGAAGPGPGRAGFGPAGSPSSGATSTTIPSTRTTNPPPRAGKLRN